MRRPISMLGRDPLCYWLLPRWHALGVWEEPAWLWPFLALPFFGLLLNEIRDRFDRAVDGFVETPVDAQRRIEPHRPNGDVVACHPIDDGGTGAGLRAGVHHTQLNDYDDEVHSASAASNAHSSPPR